jgi:aspartyl-tRNA(Asn)/glutamyl-tRNA(Gln) amidotransferase subunit A
MNLNEKTLHELLALIEIGEIATLEVIDDLYRAIAMRDKSIRAYISVAEKETLLAEAQALAQTPLKGLPASIKDNISTVAFPTTCGSQFLQNFRPIFDATVIVKLRAAGATLLGKTNLDEFAMGSSTENSSFFTTHNPHDLERVPGGSSGGSTAAVAAHEALFALGSDTGGSIRQPAALCGVVGLKPTYGLVSRYGLVAFASSLDQIGSITKDVRDAALVLNIIAGHDPHDSTSLKVASVNCLSALGKPVKGLRIGLPRAFLEGLSSEAVERLKDWTHACHILGAQLIDIELPHAEYAIPTYYLLASSEASANLARYDGVRYSARASDESLEALFAESRDRGFGAEVKRRIMLGTYALSSGYYEAFYGKAQQVRALIKQDFDRAFAQLDLIMMPTSPTPAFKVGEKIADPLQMYLTDIYTVPASLAGIPAISIPGGQVDGLPFGLQLVANTLEEAKLLRAAHAFESAFKGRSAAD